jgi:hypothetical protein
MCLGVKADENLIWYSHIETICKASVAIGAMKRTCIKPYVPMHTLESILTTTTTTTIFL